MKKTMTKRSEMKLIGITVRTNNVQETDKLNGKIFPCVQQYFHQALCEKIPNRKAPGTTICAYTNYESDHTGDYTYFIGEEVTSTDTSTPEGFETLVIPEQDYAIFTNGPAPMPEVIVDAWEAIWKMDAKDLGGKRNYQTDFEVYDERAADHNNIILDIFIGVTA